MEKRINYFVIILFFICSISLFLFLSKNIFKEIKTDFGLIQLACKTQSNFHDFIRYKENELWESLQQQHGISRKEFNRYKDYCREDYKKIEEELVESYSQGELSSKTISFVQTLLREFNIDPSTITIIPWGLSAAAATQNHMFINEETLSKFNQESQEWVVAHEIIHILHDDHMNNSIFRKIFGDEELNKVDHIVNKIKRFQEIRADVLSALQDKEYAQGYLNFFKKFIKFKGDHDTLNCTHPKSSDRLQIAQQIFDNIYTNNLSIA